MVAMKRKPFKFISKTAPTYSAVGLGLKKPTTDEEKKAFKKAKDENKLISKDRKRNYKGFGTKLAKTAERKIINKKVNIKKIKEINFNVRVYIEVAKSKNKTRKYTESIFIDKYIPVYHDSNGKIRNVKKYRLEKIAYKFFTFRQFFLRGNPKNIRPFLDNKYVFGDDGKDLNNFIDTIKKYQGGDELYTAIQSWMSEIDRLVFSIENVAFDDPFNATEINYYTQEAYDDGITPYQTKYINFQLEDDTVNQHNYTNEYVLENYIENACWYNVILDTYKDDFDKHYKTFELTYEYLYEFFHGEKFQYDSKMGLSLETALKFFRHFKLGVVVFDINNRIRAKFLPKEENLPQNKHISPDTIYIQMYNKHITRINSDINSIKKQLNSFDMSEDLIKTPSTKFYIPQNKPNKIFRVINGIDDIVELLKQENDVEAIYNDNLFWLWRDIKQKLNFEAEINFRGNVINSLYISSIVYNQTKISIRISDTFSMNAGQLFIDDNETYKLFVECKNKFSTSLLNKNYLSRYSDKVGKYFQYYKRGGIKGGFGLEIRSKMLGLDYNKYYTSIAMKMPSIPVYNSFDDFVDYNGEEIEDLNIYKFEKINESLTYPMKRNGLAYGSNIKRYRNNVRIHEVLRPSVLKPNIIPELVKELYSNNSLDTAMKKFIVNQTIGTLGKRLNTTHYSKAFTDKEEAYTNYKRLGGSVFPTYLRTLEELGKEFYDYRDEKVYFHYLSKKTEIEEGFYPIALYIYDTAEAELFDLVDKARERGMTVYGVNTDCIYVNKIIGDFDIGTEIGQLKIEEKEFFNFKTLEIEETPNICIGDIKQEINTIVINDEWDKEEIKSKLVNKTIIQAVETAGAGKTTALKQLDKDKTLFIIPFNSQREDLTNDGYNAITHYKLLGLRMSGSSTETTKKFDISGYDNIIFDEIFLHKTYDLARIKEFMDLNTDKNFFATGDIDQLRPIEDLNNIVDTETYYKNIIYNLFYNHIYLRQNKRMTTEEDRMKSKEISKIFLTGNREEVYNCILKNFKVIYDIKDLETTKNIVAFNDTHDWINKKFDKGFYVGLKMICKIQILRKEARTYVNFIYTIKKLGKTVILSNREGDIEVSFDELKRNFKMAYAQTCHSAQGLTINEPFTIFDALSHMATGKWLYTAYTRGTDFRNITFCLNKGNEITKMKSIINRHLEQHKQEDEKKNRKFDLTVDWVYNKIKLCGYSCCICKGGLDTTGYEAFSINRIDNKFGHQKFNVEIICRRCNISLK